MASIVTSATSTTTPDIVIIGSGFAGIGMAIQLKCAGRNDFIVLEKDAQIGGTWRDNTYPGAACDVESHLYSYSFVRKPDWSHKYSPQQEIFGYIDECVQRYQLAPHIRLASAVDKLSYCDVEHHWRIQLTNGDVLTARVVITATGQLNQPNTPCLEGQQSFCGTQFHSARWRHDLDLSGKRVGVIGTGASAIQFVPQIAKHAQSVTIFQRSPAWVIAKRDAAFTRWQQWCFKQILGCAKIYRSLIYIKNEARALAFTRLSWVLKYAEWQAKRMARRDIHDLTKRAAIIPDYQAGCNRILLANDWYSTIDQAHVELVTAPIQQLTANGIATELGPNSATEHELDVIIYATGFRATEFLAPMTIQGRNGRTLNETWSRGAEAYKGINVSGFPNLFILYGPNTNLSHSSILLMLEAQFHYVLACLKSMESRHAKSMDVKAAPQQQYVNQLDKKLQRSVWASGCNSWYLTEHGRNVINWFGFTFSYRRLTQRVNHAHYDFLGQERDHE